MICDRITIMKHGHSVGCYEMQGMNEQDISRLMIGRDAVHTIQKTKPKKGEVILKIQNLCTAEEGQPKLKNLTMTLRRGEVLGIAGVEGNGQKDLVECLAGLRRSESGEILFKGEDIRNKTPRQMRERGISHVSEDRIGQGSAGDASIENNIIADKLLNGKMMKGLFIDFKKSEAFVKEQIRKYDITADSMKQPIRMLSGGNMQKVVIARELSDEPELLLANQPTRGVDVGAMQFIHQNILALRDKGAGVLLVSADLNEILDVSDSIIVMFGGTISAYFENASDVTEEELGYYMLGVKHQDPEEIAERMMSHE